MKLLGKIEKIHDLELHSQVNLKKFTTYKLEVVGDIVICKSENSLAKLVKLLNENKYLYNVVGWGANQVISTTEDVLFIKLDFQFDNTILKSPQKIYDLPASVPLNILTSHAQKYGLVGWEVFSGIPASLGGAIFMNAGTGLGEICEVIESVRIMDKNSNIREVSKKDLKFSYRHNHFVEVGEIIVSAKLKNIGLDEKIGEKIKDYLEFRKNTQPLNSKNCGCVFKNFDKNVRAGQSIDLIGLKGFKLGGLMISPKHANFIENYDNASSKDFNQITEFILDELEYNTGIRFELEAKVY